METKKAIVSNVLQNVKQWNSPSGTIFYHEISFINGDKGSYGSKSETCTKFVTGQEAEYTIETKTNGQYTNVVIKPVQSQQSFSGNAGKKSFAGNESFALSYAKDLACANIAAGKPITSEETVKIAEVFYNWLQSKKGVANG